MLSEASEHDADHGQADECLVTGGKEYVVFDQRAGQVQPADGPFDDPPPLEQDLRWRRRPTTLLQQQGATSATLHAARVDHQSVHQAEGVHQKMPLTAFDQLAAIKAALEPAPLDRPDGLAVQDCGGWLRIATSGPTNLRSQAVVQLLPGAVVAPATEVRPGGAPGTRSRGTIRH